MHIAAPPPNLSLLQPHHTHINLLTNVNNTNANLKKHKLDAKGTNLTSKPHKNRCEDEFNVTSISNSNSSTSHLVHMDYDQGENQRPGSGKFKTWEKSILIIKYVWCPPAGVYRKRKGLE